jgi:hypothetical protein
MKSWWDRTSDFAMREFEERFPPEKRKRKRKAWPSSVFAPRERARLARAAGRPPATLREISRRLRR